ncbi:peptide ABC transporter DppA [Mycolicibacterium phlei]|uniref:peptide ABC transporter substrate-binding protein n=1 Tax=Mycobacteroides chelonae TaxID=1774 RepID=UPI000618AE28|nr:ABC transporter substrate-binding protein [Mycobacteroides chelonae]VEG15801.1 peptide ABC transporter DppA [Mycolicibacterium phlei]AKC38483.1 peptide ABC transporter [Mycobacteroides chelonae]ANA97717.1 peptide ABC transporter [Mycobacteroides chelonae CCUG 47445]OLT75151.1 peptide ABC transporter [Mycobacteroides chelonae]ORV12799.1 peptide ABC transporter [Mycobacteroides chelonae]
MKFVRLATVLVITVAALMPAGCGDLATHAPAGYFSAFITEPRNPLVPGNTTENQGARILRSLFTALVEFNSDTAAVEYSGAAESITSTNNVNWTIKLKPSWTFHNGEPVTAQSYVDAWNYTALSTNAQGSSSFFANIDGFDDLQGDSQTNAPPRETKMRGLQFVDDLTFTVRLSAPFAIFPMTLGYNAFLPLPKVFYQDPQKFGVHPIGNGPFKADTDWVRGVGFTLSRYDQYPGPKKAKGKGIEFRVYTELRTAYTDMQAGSLDIQLDLPEDAFENAKAEFGDAYLERQRSDITSLGFPLYDQRYADPRVRKAISMAIDREVISSVIFSGTQTPASSYGSPAIFDFRKGACGKLCELHVEEANKLLDEAGFDRSQPVDLWFNSGAGHEGWVQAIGHQLQSNLGLSYRLKTLPFSQILPLQDQKGMTGPFRDGWVMDYPSIYNFLDSLYGTVALPPRGSNHTFYSNPEFDKLLRQGNSAPTIEEANRGYQKAEDLLFKDFPAAPLFYGVNQAVHSNRVSNVKIGINDCIEWADVQVAD